MANAPLERGWVRPDATGAPPWGQCPGCALRCPVGAVCGGCSVPVEGSVELVRVDLASPRCILSRCTQCDADTYVVSGTNLCAPCARINGRAGESEDTPSLGDPTQAVAGHLLWQECPLERVGMAVVWGCGCGAGSVDSCARPGGLPQTSVAEEVVLLRSSALRGRCSRCDRPGILGTGCSNCSVPLTPPGLAAQPVVPVLGPLSERSIRHFFPLRVYRSCGACEQLRQPGPGECLGCGLDDGAHTRFADADDEAERLGDLAADFALRSFLFRQRPQPLATEDRMAGPLATLTDSDIGVASVAPVDAAPNSGLGGQAASEQNASRPGLNEAQAVSDESGPAGRTGTAETTAGRDVAPNRIAIDVDTGTQMLDRQANRQDPHGLTFNIDAMSRAVTLHVNSPDVSLPGDADLQAVANVQFSLLYCIIFNGLADFESGLIQRLGEPVRADMIGLLGRAILVFGDAR